MMKKDYSFGVIPVYKGDKEPLFLLIYHSTAKYWGFPKGHKEGDETDIETVRRELLEETGISEIDILDEPKLEDKYIFQLHGETYDKTAVFYIGRVKVMPELKLQEKEVSDAKWLTYEEALKIIEFESLKEVLKQANKIRK